MDAESPNPPAPGSIRSALRPSRPVLAVFGLLVALVLQHFLRRPLGDFTPSWFETWLPFAIADRAMELLLAPVFLILDVFYEQFAPDWVAIGLILCYFYLLAVAIASLYERVVAAA